MSAWMIQTRVLKADDLSGQLHSDWELRPYSNGHEIQYPIFPNREEGRRWRKRVCPIRGTTRIHPINHIDLIVDTPQGLVTVIRALDPV